MPRPVLPQPERTLARIAAAPARGRATEEPVRARRSGSGARHPRRPVGMTQGEWAFARVYGRNLRRARERRRISQDALAALMSVTRNTIARWESGASLLSHYQHGRLELVMETRAGEL